MKNKILKNWLLIVISAGCLLGCVLSYAVREKQHSNVSFIPASNEPSDCMHIGDCRENQIPRPLGHCKFDTPLLAVGFLTGPSIESSQLWVDAPEEITLQNDNCLGYRIKQNSEKINRSNFLEYSIINYPEIEFDDEEANKEMGVKINKLFYEKTMLHYDEKLEQEVNAFYSCDYFVSFADENFISIYFVESISAGMSSVTTYEDAITISLKTGDMVSLENFGNINKVMEKIYNYKGIIYTDRVFEVEDWEKNKKKFIEQWEEREDACYYGYYLYNGRIGILFDHYQTGRVRMGLEFQGIAASKEEKQEEKENTSIDIMMEDDMLELENKADEISETKVVADYLEMSSEEFSNKYSRDGLYKEGILYCGMEAWKYQGTQLDAYQEDYYDVTNITAIRFENNDQASGLIEKEILMIQNSEHVYIKYFGDYAVSMYFPENDSGQNNDGEELQLKEISYVKVEMKEGTADEMLYSYLEKDYYQVREELQEAMWIESPEGTKEVCVSNGSLPKHPSQIFIRYKENFPDVIYRRDWQCEIVGWIDEEHLICNEIDMRPILIHLESNQVEQIKKEEDDYDTYGAKYRIDGNYLICQFMDEEIYRWNIISGQDEIDLQNSRQDIEISDEISFEENSYFFNNNHVYLKANAIYDDMIHSKFTEEDVCAEIHFIKQYEQGNLYKLAIEPLGGLTDERLNIYFYVMSEKIYRLWSYVYQDDKVITFYDDDELLTKVLDTDEKLINNGQIVCQNEEMQSESKEGDLEFQFGISRMENQIEYSSCTITPNGEIDYYENFRWEEGKGLIEFCSGYCAEREPLYLTEITQISEGRYRRLRMAVKHMAPDK